MRHVKICWSRIWRTMLFCWLYWNCWINVFSLFLQLYNVSNFMSHHHHLFLRNFEKKNRLHFMLMFQFDESVTIELLVRITTVVLYDIMYITAVLTLSITFISIFGVILVETQNFTRDFTHGVKMLHVNKHFWHNKVVDWQYYCHIVLILSFH